MSSSQFQGAGHVYLDMPGLIPETSMWYWWDQQSREKKIHISILLTKDITYQVIISHDLRRRISLHLENADLNQSSF